MKSHGSLLVVLTRMSTSQALVREDVAEGIGSSRKPQPLAGEMGHVDKVRAVVNGGLAGLGSGVVAQVGGDIQIGVAGPHLVKQGISGPAADRDPPDQAVLVAGNPDAACHGGKNAVHPRGEVAQGHGLGKIPHPADAFLGKAVRRRESAEQHLAAPGRRPGRRRRPRRRSHRWCGRSGAPFPTR